ncbi:hypothetical protein D3C76_1549700 [compost metagenome]
MPFGEERSIRRLQQPWSHLQQQLTVTHRSSDQLKITVQLLICDSFSVLFPDCGQNFIDLAVFLQNMLGGKHPAMVQQPAAQNILTYIRLERQCLHAFKLAEA